MTESTPLSPTQARPLLVITGPTASGKSRLALEICEALGGEIITADSRQVYRYMDIGTEKPSREDRLRVPHHLLDLVDPDEPYTLAMYQEAAYAIIDDTLGRGKLPVLAGGTPLYVNAVVEGWTIPRVEPNIEMRASLEALAEQIGSEALHARLAFADPDAAASILPTNTRRIVRALEVIELTGEPISTQQRKVAPPYSVCSFVLAIERTALYSRIDRRVDEQVERGLVAEVTGLSDRGYSFSLPSMSGIGYRQIGEYLQGRATLEAAVQRMKWDTHSFARHQENWFRRATESRHIDVTRSDPFAQVLEIAREFLDSMLWSPPATGGSARAFST